MISISNSINHIVQSLIVVNSLLEMGNSHILMQCLQVVVRNTKGSMGAMIWDINIIRHVAQPDSLEVSLNSVSPYCRTLQHLYLEYSPISKVGNRR